MADKKHPCGRPPLSEDDKSMWVIIQTEKSATETNLVFEAKTIKKGVVSAVF